MAVRSAAARGDAVEIVADWGPFDPLRGDVLLPGPDARVAPIAFDDWLARRS